MSVVIDGTTGITAPAINGPLDAADLTGSLPALDGSALTSLSAGNLTGALPAISGAALTGLPIITSQSLSSNGYIVVGGELIVQWGTTGSVGSGGSVVVTLPIAFTSSASYSLSANSTTNPAFINVTGKTSTTITLRSSGGSSTAIYWVAVGY